MDIVMHFPMNCKLYFQLNQLPVALSQPRSGGSFATSQSRKFVLILLQCLCTAACKAVNVNGNTWWGARAVSACGESHRLSLWAHQELSSARSSLCGQGGCSPCILVLLCADVDHIWYQAENIHLLILQGIQNPWNKMFSTVVIQLIWSTAFLFSRNHA